MLKVCVFFCNARSGRGDVSCSFFVLLVVFKNVKSLCVFCNARSGRGDVSCSFFVLLVVFKNVKSLCVFL